MTRVGGEGVGEGPLAGFRVVDVSTSIAGGFCTKLLADYGAEVIRVEPPGGDPTRVLGRAGDGDGGAGAGSVFAHLHTNKLGIVVDTSGAEGQAVVRALVLAADVLVESGCPGDLAALGLAPDDLLDARPALVITSVTPFGQTGPYASYRMTEIVAYAMGGPMSSTGSAAVSR
jgi:crotonobetainyl-CoA:carnitine CoA-transferase CaiB-like acyl-CoA transferase